MAMFSALGVAGSGMLATRKWLDAVSDNIANLNNVSRTSERAFQARMVVVQAEQYGNAGGVRVAGAAFGDPQGRVVHQPDHPLADEGGYVRVPDIDLGDQMTQMMIAQRGYQANVSVVKHATDAYTQALQLGKRR
jgi:flagellar basal-body rod protein FlgC